MLCYFYYYSNVAATKQSKTKETMSSPSAKHKKHNGESPEFLTPEQVRVGTNAIVTHAERQAFWRNSEVGKLLGFDRWPDVKQEDDK